MTGIFRMSPALLCALTEGPPSQKEWLRPLNFLTIPEDAQSVLSMASCFSPTKVDQGQARVETSPARSPNHAQLKFWLGRGVAE